MCVFPSEYARSRHYGVFYVQNLKVFAFRILKNYVGKSAKFESVQKVALCLGNLPGCAIMGSFAYSFFKVSTLRILKNSVCKSAYSVFIAFALLGSFA